MNSLNSSELLTFCASFDENETSYFFFLFLMYYLGFVIQLYHESELFSFKYTYPSDSRHLTDTKTVKLSLCRCQHILQCSIYHHLSVAKTATVKRSPDRNWRRSRSQHAADMQQLCIVVMMVVLVSEYRHHLSHSVTCQCCWVLWMTLWSPVFSFSQPSRPLPLFKIPPSWFPLQLMLSLPSTRQAGNCAITPETRLTTSTLLPPPPTSTPQPLSPPSPPLLLRAPHLHIHTDTTSLSIPLHWHPSCLTLTHAPSPTCLELRPLALASSAQITDFLYCILFLSLYFYFHILC